MAENIEVTLQKLAAQNTKTQMDWQERMSKTSHQMEVADLKKSGLNPVLSANNGATSYSTSVDSAVNALAGIHNQNTASKAQLKAAAQSAAATRYAAAQSAAATRYAAAQNAAAAMYQANMSYQAQKYNTDYSKNGSIAGTIGSILNRGLSWLSQNTSPSQRFQAVKSVFTPKSSSGLTLNFLNYAIKNKSNVASYSTNMSSYERSAARSDLLRLGFVNPTDYQITQYAMYASTGKSAYLKKLYNSKRRK